MEKLKLWSEGYTPDYQNPPVIEGVEFTMLYDTIAEKGAKFFMHGISVEEHGSRLCTAWAFNKEFENVKGEQCIGRWSSDGGKTWGNDFEITANTAERSPSHGVMFSDGGKMYYLLPTLEFYGTTDWTKWDCEVELHVYNDETNTWEYVSDCIHNFWPLSRPQPLANGGYALAGLGNGRSRVAVSDGADISKPWKVIAMDIPKDTSFSEPALLVQGERALLVSRNDNVTEPDTLTNLETGRYTLGAAISEDGCKTFTPELHSDIFASPSKPYGSVLSDGRPFLIFNHYMENYNARRRLLLAVGEPGTLTFNKLYTLDTRIGALSYPYSYEKDGMLYVVYSSSIGDRVDSNRNNMKIAVFPIKNI